jgi:hypothetical protein
MAAAGAGAQAIAINPAMPEAARAAAAATGTVPASSEEVLRALQDPWTGDHWLVVRDGRHPAGPGRLVLMERGAGARNAVGDAGTPPAPEQQRYVIRAGDALVVEEHSAVVDARLAAVALGPAVAGQPFRARLKIGGRVVRAVAVAAGCARLAAESEGQP